MTAAVGIHDRRLEQEVLSQLESTGVRVVRRCITAADANSLASDVELIIDSSFKKKYGDRLQRNYRLLSNANELVHSARSSSRLPSPALITFCGVSGGVGTTSLSLYSAALAASRGRILVIDADLFRPAAQIFMSSPVTNPGKGLWQAVAQSSVAEAIKWQGNVWLLAGIDSPSRRHQIDSDGWNALLDAALLEFDEVRIDLGNNVVDEHPVVTDSISRSSKCVLIAKAHPASAIAMPGAHSYVTRHSSAITVLNQFKPGPIAATSERIITSSIQQSLICIPEDRQGFDEAFIAGSALSSGPGRAAIETLNKELVRALPDEPTASQRVPTNRRARRLTSLRR
jgi:MinD-like ATPase involved in chromosome partitioning or flagellar assembly